MQTYQLEQISRFLEAVDGHLDAPLRMVIIGGSAALLKHGATSPTRDIDTFETEISLIHAAALAAAADLGFAVPIGSGNVGDLPLHYQDREERVLPQLRHLHIVVPERHDLVLSKLLRASQTDLAVCREIHEYKPLDASLLVRRYLHEMGHAIGRERDHDLNLVAGAEYLWHAEIADRIERTLTQHREVAANRRS